MLRKLAALCTLTTLVLALAGPSLSAQGGGPKAKPRKAPPATLRSDRPDYGPGTLAILSGSGFLPNETVHLSVGRADGTPVSDPFHQPWVAAANERGVFVTSWHVC